MVSLINAADDDSIKCLLLRGYIEMETNNNIWPSYNADLKLIAEKNAKTANIMRKLFYLELFSDAITNEGFLNEQNGRFSEALADYHKSLEIKFDIGDRDGVANNLLNIGYLYHARSEYNKAVDYYNKALKIQEETKDKGGAAITIVNLANIAIRKGDTLMYVKLIEKALSYRKEIDDKRGVANCYNSLAVVEATKADKTQALDYCNKALTLFEEIGNKEGAGNTYNNFGAIYSRIENMPKAIEYYLMALKINREIKDHKSTCASLFNIGKIYNFLNEQQKAESYFKEALKYAKLCGETRDIKKVSEQLYTFYKALGRTEEARAMNRLFLKQKDSVDGKLDISLREETRETENEPVIENRADNNETPSGTLWAISASVIVLSLLLIIVYARWKRKF